MFGITKSRIHFFQNANNELPYKYDPKTQITKVKVKGITNDEGLIQMWKD